MAGPRTKPRRRYGSDVVLLLEPVHDVVDEIVDGLVGELLLAAGLRVEFSMTAMELNTKAGGQQEFPYESVDDLVDDIMDGLEQQDYI